MALQKNCWNSLHYLPQQASASDDDSIVVMLRRVCALPSDSFSNPYNVWWCSWFEYWIHNRKVLSLCERDEKWEAGILIANKHKLFSQPWEMPKHLLSTSYGRSRLSLKQPFVWVGVCRHLESLSDMFRENKHPMLNRSLHQLTLKKANLTKWETLARQSWRNSFLPWGLLLVPVFRKNSLSL